MFLEQPNVITLTLFFLSVFVFMVQNYGKKEQFQIFISFSLNNLHRNLLNGIIFDSISKILSMKYLFLLSVAIFTLGCKTAKESAHQTPEISRLKITASLGEINIPSDPIEITAVRVEGNTMFIDMNYTGGCEEHTFSVVGSEMISKSLFIKSLFKPAIIILRFCSTN